MAKQKKQPTTKTVQTNKPSVTENLLQQFEDKVLWQLIILIALPFFLYIKVTSFSFIDMDDVAIITNNYNIIGNIKNIGTAFTTDAFLGTQGDFYRPIQTVSFMIDALLGGEKPWIYHLTNLIYHLATIISLFYLLRLLQFKNSIAFLMSLLFALHPVLSSAVSWVPARGDVLIGLWGIWLLISFHQFIQKNNWFYFALHTVMFALALFTKETSLVFPILLLAYYFLVLQQKFNAKKLLPFILGWLLPIALFLYMRSKVVVGTPPDFILGIQPFFQNIAALPTYTGKFLLPFALSTMPLFTTVATIMGTIVLVVFIFFSIQLFKQKKWLPLLGLLWFVAFITPPMLFKLFYSKFLLEYYQHRAYLPYVGLIIFLGSILNNWLTQKKYIAINFTVLLIIIFIPLASFHADAYKTSYTFFGNAIDNNNPGAAVKRGELYVNNADRDFAAALTDFNTAIDLSDNQYPPAFFNRGKIYSTVNKNHEAAEQDFTTTINLDKDYIEAYILRAEERIYLQNIAGATEDLQKAKQLDANNANIYYMQGKVYVSSNKFDEANNSFTKAIQLDTLFAELYNDRAFVRYRLKKYDDALTDCNKAISLNPLFLNAYYNKGMIYYETARYNKALATLDTTLMLANNFYFGFFYRGMAKKQLNDLKGACNDWQQSVNLGFTMAQDTINRYCK